MENLTKRERDWLDKVWKENEECDWEYSLEETKILNCLGHEFKSAKMHEKIAMGWTKQECIA